MAGSSKPLGPPGAAEKLAAWLLDRPPFLWVIRLHQWLTDRILERVFGPQMDSPRYVAPESRSGRESRPDGGGSS